jgi:hypothetical protein
MKGPSWIKIFSPVALPQGLRAAVLARIAGLERARARARVGLFGAASLVCAALLVPAVQYAAAQFYASGFGSYLSLVFSDQGLVLTYWREFGLLLVESLPSIALLILIPLALAFLWSLRQALRSAPAAFTTRSA